ncbi:transglycosylase SLT domain-containing protein [Candidatus Symbiobacter mobilis]|uniref:Lytic murein transglycosylase-like protein n=1 Tax=Candidatus Symbiobacter mobilis CR TaxID=946483 RepID=U5NDD3_9BURK|nr:transglycosylase SLT domain-containing protein [Candidatus Symbiobacter mobilis]AGX88253.1 lytic murein transglycosylase-like protein [Candidatus Symbiobacter mobilis CR]
MTACHRLAHGLQCAVSVAAQGCFDLARNGVVLLGIAVLFVALVFVARPELRHVGELQLFDLLHRRQIAAWEEAQATTQATTQVTNIPRRPPVTLPKQLPKPQAAVAAWLSKKYRVAPEPMVAVVAEAYELGRRTRIEPTLILAVMAVESGFNPFAQSSMGAQGLMQVMTRVHSDKYRVFGGRFAAFDPLANLHVGVRVLQDCIRAAGSIEGGLRSYVGATAGDGGYTAKVLAEHARLRQVAQGHRVPTIAPTTASRPQPTVVPPTLAWRAEPTAGVAME